MNKGELIEAVAARAGSDQAAARRHVDAIFETIMASVAGGDRVMVTGFGTFDSFDRPARKARNPRTGLPVEVAAAQVPRFRIGQTFKSRVADGASATAVAEAETAAVVDEPKGSKPKKNKKKKAKAADGKAKPAEARAAKAAKPANAKKASTKKPKKSKKS
ncbi:HU family DNA-binding protein [Spirillospora sp. NPDC048911]|uniref:HU family DNA-binding protein n=1 Tax=Spirillospora sp. NPDC048911 TaxID=3364527 RepID=UPI0037103377